MFLPAIFNRWCRDLSAYHKYKVDCTQGAILDYILGGKGKRWK